MPTLLLTTKIKAPIERVFDLARSLDLHKISTGKSNEEAIAGKTSGLINEGEAVTWLATHLGVRQTLTTLITKMERPAMFQDKMVKGAFKSMLHDHLFEQQGEYTIMKDVFHFESPGGILGKIVNMLFLTRYMQNVLEERNKVIKEFAEGEKYKEIFNSKF
jgi:ligand-binding SRPBCC domain-containing protein